MRTITFSLDKASLQRISADAVDRLGGATTADLARHLKHNKLVDAEAFRYESVIAGAYAALSTGAVITQSASLLLAALAAVTAAATTRFTARKFLSGVSSEPRRDFVDVANGARLEVTLETGEDAVYEVGAVEPVGVDTEVIVQLENTTQLSPAARQEAQEFETIFQTCLQNAANKSRWSYESLQSQFRQLFDELKTKAGGLEDSRFSRQQHIGRYAK